MKSAAWMQTKKWQVFEADSRAAELGGKLRISEVVSQVLINRGLHTSDGAKAFLEPKLTGLIEPALLPGVEQAAQRIITAVEAGQKIAIYGDYDVDGITSVAILWHLLEMMGADVEYYIPHRIDEGYGLNTDAVRQLIAAGVKLIVTVDCGITANGEIALAKQLGADVIITDHHQPPAHLPPADVIVHPSLDEFYPNPQSAGAMVAFKLAWGLVNRRMGGAAASPELREFLLSATTLAAMGTIADVVDLQGENRILTHFGLRALPESKLAGIRALIESADLTGKDIDSYDIAFRLGPMLNAAGRMGHARLAVELLTSDSEMRCMQIAEYLKQQNRKRQKLQREIFTQARQMINHLGLNHPDRRTIVLADENWHSGVIGIVASKIIEEYFRPAIMINTSEDVGRGSGRSVDGFDMYAALSACSEHLVSFGGHKMAAGLQVEKDKVAGFAEAFESYARENMQPQCCVSTLEIDAVCRVRDFNEAVVRQLGRLEPFGRANPEPMFASYGVKLIAPPRRVGQKGDHLQLSIADQTGAVRCIGFGMGRLEKKLQEADTFNIAYNAQINSYNGNSSVQFALADVQFE